MLRIPSDTEVDRPEGDLCPGGFERTAEVVGDPALPCQLKPGLPLDQDPRYMLVSLDGQKLLWSPDDRSGDYRWIGDALELLGAVCERSKVSNAEAHSISIRYGGCPAAIGHCDDHLVLIEPSSLRLEADRTDLCLLHFENRPARFEPARFMIRLDSFVLVRDAADGYRLEADSVRLLGAVCSRFAASDAGPHAIRASYGPCYNLE